MGDPGSQKIILLLTKLMSARYKQKRCLVRTPVVRQEAGEKGPVPAPSGKCPVVSNVIPGPPVPSPSNNQQRTPVVSPPNGQQKNGQQMNNQQRTPVVSPTNGQMNGQMNGQQMNGYQRAPVVSPTNGQQIPGRDQIGSSRANNGAWSMIQQGGQDQNSQSGMWSQSSIWQRDPEVRTSIGQIQRSPVASQSGMNQQIWTPEPNSRTNIGQLSQAGNQVNLNESGQSYLMADSDGRIILARNGANYQLAGDEQGRVLIQTDGQCGVWVQVLPSPTSTSGPSMAQMIRGQEGGQIISGMQSGPVSPPTPNVPVAPITARGNVQTRGQISSRPNWYHQQLAPNTDDWYATQW